jgi:2-polyprenyl-3-methyl-5-hydroxy-6-metoxy-1,4-benzoquinol methylase
MDKAKFDKYDKFAYSTVYSEPDTPEFHTPLIKLAVESFFDKLCLPKDSVIFDIGCGQGAFMEEMKSRGYVNITGVTLSDEDVKACNDKGFNTVKSNMSDLEVKDGQLDFIWCRHAIEHSPYPFFTLLEFNRALKNGGGLYIEVPAPELERFHEFNSNHYSILAPRMWGALFQRSGFVVETFNEMAFEVKMPEAEGVKEIFYCFLLKKKNEISYS